MAMDFFRIYRGLELDEATQFLTGTGTPGASGDTATAPRGSYFTDTDTGDLWTKVASGAGTDKWRRLATEDYVNSVTTTGLSWREPSDVRDNTSTTVAAIKADLDADDLIQGVAVYVGMRILGSNVTGNKNIFIVGGVSGDWTLTEDLNPETPGDTTYVIGGTDAGRTFQYDQSGNWIWINSDDQAELAFLRAFVGKDAAGSELPNYGTPGIVANGDSLETAIGKLDTEAGYVNTFIGKSAGADTPDYSSTNWVTDGQSLETAIGDLDAAIGAAVTNGFVILAANDVNENITELDDEVENVANFIGKPAAGTGLPNYAHERFVSDGDSLVQAVDKLDARLYLMSASTSATSVTSIITLDSVTAEAAEWDVFVRDVGTPTRVRALKVFAMHNGVNVDSTQFAVLTRGGMISGLSITVTLTGGDTLNLNVQSTAAVNVKAQRLAAIV